VTTDLYKKSDLKLIPSRLDDNAAICYFRYSLSTFMYNVLKALLENGFLLVTKFRFYTAKLALGSPL